jgi:epsin
MDFMKVFDQTVREIKREVNLKVLKVPEIEQKVLDATSDEPWGPHGSALSELAQATKKFAECQMVMNVLWTRLGERGANWRHVYKALTIIEYLIANGSERAVDDILDHYSKISVLSSFEYVEPNGKDAGINVRKKVETIVGILNDKERIKAVRDKAASNRDKYIGLSSTGITYKSSSASFGNNYSSGERYGSFSGTREGDSFGDSYRDKEPVKTSTSKTGSKLRKDTKSDRRNEDYSSPSSLKPPSNTKSSEDDFDDFDPRRSNGKAAAKSTEVDLFGPNLMDDFIDASAAIPATDSAVEPQVDLFADADFQSATTSTETTANMDVQVRFTSVYMGKYQMLIIHSYNSIIWITWKRMNTVRIVLHCCSVPMYIFIISCSSAIHLRYMVFIIENYCRAMLTFLRKRLLLLQHSRHRLGLFHHQVPGYLLK